MKIITTFAEGVQKRASNVDDPEYRVQCPLGDFQTKAFKILLARSAISKEGSCCQCKHTGDTSSSIPCCVRIAAFVTEVKAEILFVSLPLHSIDFTKTAPTGMNIETKQIKTL